MKSDLKKSYQELKGYPLTIFFICLVAWTLSNMDQAFFGFVIPDIREEFDASLTDISWILTASFLFTAVCVVVIGLLADRYGRRVMLVVCLALSALMVGAQAFASTLVVLGVLRALAFGISGGLSPITNTFTVEATPNRYRGLMTGLLQCGYPLGWFIASLMSVPIMNQYGWRAIFLLALLVVPVAFVIGRFLPESARFRSARQDPHHAAASGKAAENIKALFRPDLRRRTLLIALTFFTYGGAYAGTAFYFPDFYTKVRGYTVSEATTLIGLSYGVGVIGYIAAAVTGEFFTTRRNTTVAWLWLGAASLLGLVWLPTSYAQDFIWFSIMAGFFYGTNGVIATLLTESFPTRVRATGAALAGSAAISIGFASYPRLVAEAVEAVGWQWAFTFAVVPSLVVGGFAILALPNTRSGIDVDEIAT